MTADSSEGKQPLLYGQVVTFRAPTQVWSGPGGDADDAPIHGVYHADARVLRGLTLTVGHRRPEWISVVEDGASHVVFTGVIRDVESDGGADPRLRIDRARTVGVGTVNETITLTSARRTPVCVEIVIGLHPDFTPLRDIKAGRESGAAWRSRSAGDTVVWASGPRTATVEVPGGRSVETHSGADLTWRVAVPAGGRAEVTWHATLMDTSAVVQGVSSVSTWARHEHGPVRDVLHAWLQTALKDLDALRLTTTSRPDQEFFAAGAPWFFTLFGRDALWTARLMLPLTDEPALSTLETLAQLQGTKTTIATAEQPGKIMHELRSDVPGPTFDGVVALPPLYYGTIDATPLWVCLLHDVWRTGKHRDRIEALLPAMEAALAWMQDRGDSDGDGFLEYIDESGSGLANQGWKDSGDSIQWRDGTLARGPIALCEVQAYAYEAAMGASAVLEDFDMPGARDLRRWADRLRRRFRSAFWVGDLEGGWYPAVALDADKRPVDSLTSNIGHLLGTGLLDPAEEELVGRLLTSARLNSGYGLRTLATDAAGYWPLSYHGGSVWPHDTAIAIRGLMRAGMRDRARLLGRGLVRAAQRFDFRMPELYSGDGFDSPAGAIPYPAACRPQAWSAAAAIAVYAALDDMDVNVDSAK